MVLFSFIENWQDQCEHPVYKYYSFGYTHLSGAATVDVFICTDDLAVFYIKCPS